MIPPGDLSTNLSKMCRSGLLVDLRHSIYEAGERNERVKKDGWITNEGQSPLHVAIDVIPFCNPNSKESYFAVLFSQTKEPNTPSVPIKDSVDTTHHLEQEILETKKYLNAIIEKEQASNEELKSASEEILSANEELQSTNEEMATAKEEIQATNEELSTVNHELQNRNLELRRLNNDLTNLFASVQIPIVMLTENLIVRRFTQSAEKLFNLSISDIGRSLADVKSPFELMNLPKLVSEVMESLNTRDQEIQNQDGKWYSLRIKPYRTLDNKIDGAVLALVDIDNLKRNIDDLKTAYNYADSIVQTAPIPLVVLDVNLRIVTANQAFCHHFKIPENQLSRVKIYDLADGQWNLPRLRQLLEDILPKNQVMDNFIIDHEFDSLGRRTLRLSARRLVQKTEEEAKILIAFEDLTTEKRIEEEMLVAMEASESANQAKSDFVANISHEIRTPLGVILGYSEIVANAGKDIEPIKVAISRIRSNVEQLMELISEILDISKIESGMFENDRHKFALLPELAESFLLLKNRAEGKYLAFHIEFTTDIPQYVFACAKGLRQILFNIIGNALKFTDSGEVNVIVSIIPSMSEQSGSKLCFVVTDTGCGVSKEQQVHLFKPFSQADSSVTRKYGGTGLGLLLARRLAEAQGGSVVLTESQIGVGSTFTITVDIGKLKTENMLRGVTESSMNLNEKVYSDWFVANNRLAGMNILLVEDGLDNQALMKHFLLASGATVELAVNGIEAIQKASTVQFGMILMDIQMPILDGYHATRKLRDNGYRGAILALTAHAMQGEREKCLAAGFDDYLSKPVKPNMMIQVIADLAKKKAIEFYEKPYQSLLSSDSVVGPLVAGFVGNLARRVKELRIAHQKMDWTEMGNISHQILGAADGYGFPEVGKTAALIEELSKTKVGLTDLSDAIAELEELSNKAKRSLGK